MNRGLWEYRRLRLKMDRVIRKPRIEYSAMCKSLSPKKRWGMGKGLGEEDRKNIKRQYVNNGNQ